MAERRTEHVMGMAIGIDVRDEQAAGLAVRSAFDLLRTADRTFSPYRVDSEISRIAEGTLEPDAASAEVREVLARCARLHAATAGFFDPFATGRLDPSGMVKGWAVERAAARLERAGARCFAINAGGDIVVRGEAAWRIGIQHPRRRDRLAAVVELGRGAVATSGTYERGRHIVDPRSGRPARGVLSVTVVGPDLATADAYATAAFAMGAGGAEWLACVENYAGMAILADERVLSTPAFLDLCPGGSPAASLGLRPASTAVTR